MLLHRERATLDRLLPGLDERLRAHAFMELEQPGNPGIRYFREAGGPSLVVPRSLGGKGASAHELVQLHRALGSRSPSLAVAATMHDFSLAIFVEYAKVKSDAINFLLANVAASQLLIASGFAEGSTGQHIFASAMEARKTEHGYRLNGSKRPCTLSRSMHLLSANVLVKDDGPTERRAVVLVPAELPGIERKPFWKSSVLVGAESDEVILKDVLIPPQCLFYPGGDEQIDLVEVAGYVWFHLLVSASYLGAASALVERLNALGRGGPVERTLLASELETAMSALESVALQHDLEGPAREEGLLGRAMLVRYGVQAAIERATTLAVELLGGMQFIGAPDVAYLLAASRALAFHPPSRFASANELAAFYAGKMIPTG